MRTETFYRCWTLKEAYLKARGEGFRLFLDSFDVAFLPGEMPRLLETRSDPIDATRWHFCELHPGLPMLPLLQLKSDRSLN
jgi:4'-phosphopantetheinyl transferase